MGPETDQERDDRSVCPGRLPEGLADALRATAEEIAQLLRRAPDTGAAVPGLVWTVGELAAHLAQANELMADVAAGRPRRHGDGTPEGIAAANEQALDAFAERRADPLAAMIVPRTEAYLEAVASHPAEETLLTPMGPMNRVVLGSYLLTHMLGHGVDLARALKRPHMVDRARARLTLPFLLEAMPRVTDAAATAGLNARYAVRLWGGGRFGVTFTDGTATVGHAFPDRPDCTISIEPVTFLLMALGRCSPAGAMARGRVLAWGRRPWLGPRFPEYFTAP
ncbi:maleylpyruvate isomerase family mycothiol-dependent enzyme [Streptomyces sp. ME02-7008A-1]|uniref:maleylpyruvate isomerase family mycothiol-dependent enzyme n=1 Tax=unclassified Streptomyces TaxID=2593676 RepID=UPI0029BBA703|nr:MULTISPECIES: maleylpyruvate isomerase family mycothiol-dependent enzyme [unclassified Streptomyces]MDX3180045.1 maleylpyruvate isomerase family mycothiol-dependent enzyme [Streptomyces sp. ME02-7008A-1]MDX3300786.1 maleylpyruvate isomerase family mycothiol-dependent enzyme [Streptomyces sp. ME02-7008A]